MRSWPKLVCAALLAGCPPTVTSQSAPPGEPTGELPARFAQMRNPYALGDPRALAAGRRLYQTEFKKLSCAECHGEEGRGNGPKWPYLEPRPAGFADGRLPEVFQREQGWLLYWVSEGIPRTPMPAFGQVMSEEELWQVITWCWRLGTQIEREGPGKSLDRP